MTSVNVGEEIAMVWRVSPDAPWSYNGDYTVSRELDFSRDESVGWSVMQLFRSGAVEVRVLPKGEAEALFRSTYVDAVKS